MAIELDRVTSPTPPLAFAIFLQKICSLKQTVTNNSTYSDLILTQFDERKQTNVK